MKLTPVLITVLLFVLSFVVYNKFFKKSAVAPIPDEQVLSENVEEDLVDKNKLELSNRDSRAVVIKDGNNLNIIADLPEGEYEVVGLGKLTEAKGGYILNTQTKEDIKNIEIKKGEETALEGSF